MAESIDLRLDVGFVTHPKTLELIGELGLPGAWALLTLWCHCRRYRPNGDLAGKSDAYIEGAAGWPAAQQGQLIEALLAVRYLEGPPGNRELHDWEDHQRWALGSEDRSRSASIAALIRNGKSRDEAEKIMKRREKTPVRSARQNAAGRTAEFDFPHTPQTLSQTISQTHSLSPSLPDSQSEAGPAGNSAPAEAAPEPPGGGELAQRTKPPLPPGLNGHNGHTAAVHAGTITGGELHTPEPAAAANTPGSAVWNAYAAAYQARYGVPPVRNAKNNRHCADIAKRLPAAEAPQVAAWFLRHPKAYYVSRGHALDALLDDCEDLHRQWATNTRTTTIAAQQGERLAHHVQIAQELKEEFREAAK